MKHALLDKRIKFTCNSKNGSRTRCNLGSAPANQSAVSQCYTIQLDLRVLYRPRAKVETLGLCLHDEQFVFTSALKRNFCLSADSNVSQFPLASNLHVPCMFPLPKHLKRSLVAFRNEVQGDTHNWVFGLHQPKTCKCRMPSELNEKCFANLKKATYEHLTI